MKPFKQFIKEDRREVISFDFDDTLMHFPWDEDGGGYEEDDLGNPIDIPNKELIQKMWDLKGEGYKVIIVTTRYEDKWGEETRHLIKKHAIPAEELHFTNGSWKANTLKKLGVMRHYDDNHEELKRLKYKNIEGIRINFP